jgi:N-acetylglucosamine kinase-like BadF-type ATPase
VVIGGSRANSAVRSPSGEEWHYGYYVEAELQGGTALGRMALRAVYRAATQREPPTSLTRALLAACQAESVDALLRADSESRLPLLERDMAPQVFDCAEAGDEVARQLLRQLGSGLGELVTTALQRMQMADMPVEVVLAGGLFRRRGSLLVDSLRAAILAEAPHARLVEARYEPVVGAVLLALEAAGLPVEAERAERLQASSRALGLFRESFEEEL